MQDVAGKVAFITGGANGIGLGMAKAFIAAGMKVAIADIDMDGAAKAVQSLGPNACAVQLDVTNLDAWADAVRKAETALGPVRVLCNNAGVAGARSVTVDPTLEQIASEEWHWMVAVNLTGAFYGIKTLLPRFKATQDESHIVVTASMAGITPQSAAIPSVYTVSKYGAVGLCEQLRLELEPFPHIGLSVLCPGIVQTQIQAHSLKSAPFATRLEPAPPPTSTDNAYAESLSGGMSPDMVGQRVLKGLMDRDYYIFPHPEYRPLVVAYHDEILRSFGSSAQPGYSDPVPSWVPMRRS